MERKVLIDPQLSENEMSVFEKHHIKKDLNERVTEASTDMLKGNLNIRESPFSLYGMTYLIQTGCGPLVVIIIEDEHGLFKLFTKMGKTGDCAASQSEALGRMITLAWRSGVHPNEIIRQLKDISCHSHAGLDGNRVLSCPDAVATAIRIHLTSNGSEDKIDQQLLPEETCKVCGGKLYLESGCPLCRSCGYSACDLHS